MPRPTLKIRELFCMNCGSVYPHKFEGVFIECQECEEATELIEYAALMSEKWQAHLWDMDSSPDFDE